MHTVSNIELGAVLSQS